MLHIGLAQAHPNGPSGLEALGFIQIKLAVVALAFALQHYKLIVRPRDGASQLSASIGEVLPRGVNRLALIIHLTLHLLPACFRDAGRPMPARVLGCVRSHMDWLRRRYWLGRGQLIQLRGKLRDLRIGAGE